MKTAAQLADILNVSLRSVRRWTARGEIPFVKIGRLVRFDVQSVKAALPQIKESR